MRTPKKANNITGRIPAATGAQTGRRVWSSMVHAEGQCGVSKWLLRELKASGSAAFRAGNRIHEAELLVDLERYLDEADPATRRCVECRMFLAAYNLRNRR